MCISASSEVPQKSKKGLELGGESSDLITWSQFGPVSHLRNRWFEFESIDSALAGDSFNQFCLNVIKASPEKIRVLWCLLLWESQSKLESSKDLLEPDQIWIGNGPMGLQESGFFLEMPWIVDTYAEIKQSVDLSVLVPNLSSAVRHCVEIGTE